MTTQTKPQPAQLSKAKVIIRPSIETVEIVSLGGHEARVRHADGREVTMHRSIVYSEVGDMDLARDLRYIAGRLIDEALRIEDEHQSRGE